MSAIKRCHNTTHGEIVYEGYPKKIITKYMLTNTPDDIVLRKFDPEPYLQFQRRPGAPFRNHFVRTIFFLSFFEQHTGISGCTICHDRNSNNNFKSPQRCDILKVSCVVPLPAHIIADLSRKPHDRITDTFVQCPSVYCAL